MSVAGVSYWVRRRARNPCAGAECDSERGPANGRSSLQRAVTNPESFWLGRAEAGRADAAFGTALRALGRAGAADDEAAAAVRRRAAVHCPAGLRGIQRRAAADVGRAAAAAGGEADALAGPAVDRPVATVVEHAAFAVAGRGLRRAEAVADVGRVAAAA